MSCPFSSRLSGREKGYPPFDRSLSSEQRQEIREAGQNLFKDAIKALMEYDWPGNVRELQNLVERCFTVSRDAVIQIQDISILSAIKPKMRGLRPQRCRGNL